MAIVMPLLGYFVYRLLSGASDLRSSRRLVAAGVAAYCGIVAAAFLNSIELGIQPLLHTVNGVAQYAPYGLRVTIPAMVGSHALIVGPVEAGFTVAGFAYLRHMSPELFRASDLQRVRARWLVALVVALIAVAPLGLIASGSAWGEWGAAEIEQRVGYVPHGLGRLGDLWKGLLPDYGWSGASGAWAVVAYVVSAVLGVARLTAIAWAVVSARRRHRASVLKSAEG